MVYTSLLCSSKKKPLLHPVCASLLRSFKNLGPLAYTLRHNIPLIITDHPVRSKWI